MNHAFPPLFNGQPRALILGTFPSPISRNKSEYYGNTRNQFWKILFDVFNVPFENPSYQQKKNVLFKNSIALWDVIESCESDNALDTSLRNLVYNTKLPSFIAVNKIPVVFFNGGKAYDFYRQGIGDIDEKVLLSTSPANAQYSYADKLTSWSKIKIATM